MIVKKNTPKKRHYSSLERALQKVARLQGKYVLGFAVFFLLVTIFLGYGVSLISFESDINNEMPRQLPVYQLNDKITDTFGGQDSVIILFEIDQNFSSDVAINDIRDAEMIRSIVHLHSLLEKESLVDDVTSSAMLFSQVPDSYLTNDYVIQLLDNTPQINAFFSDDYTATMLIVRADVGAGEDKLEALTNVIEKDLESVPSVPGVNVTITGSPSVLQAIMNLLRHDSLFTLVLAAFIILILLLIIEHSFAKAIMIFIPLIMGVVWTVGTMGWLGLKISVATAGLGAMLLGLGVEYGVFMLTRYSEERTKGHSQSQSLFVAVPSVGSAMLGSGLTTIVGFLALSLSIMPMLQHLGQSLALGIVYCLIAAIFLAPVVFVLEEKFTAKFHQYMYAYFKKKKEDLSK